MVRQVGDGWCIGLFKIQKVAGGLRCKIQLSQFTDVSPMNMTLDDGFLIPRHIFSEVRKRAFQASIPKTFLFAWYWDTKHDIAVYCDIALRS